MTAYAVASQALMYIDRPFYWGILSDLFYYPYWQLFGELQLEESIEGTSDQRQSDSRNMNSFRRQT